MGDVQFNLIWSWQEAENGDGCAMRESNVMVGCIRFRKWRLLGPRILQENAVSPWRREKAQVPVLLLKQGFAASGIKSGCGRQVFICLIAPLQLADRVPACKNIFCPGRPANPAPRKFTGGDFSSFLLYKRFSHRRKLPSFHLPSPPSSSLPIARYNRSFISSAVIESKPTSDAFLPLACRACLIKSAFPPSVEAITPTPLSNAP